MRRLLALACFAAALVLATQWGPGVAVASQTCSTTCSSGAQISCTVASGTCTSSPGSVSCCGQVYGCSAIDSYWACRDNCDAQYDSCIHQCRVFNPCVNNCLQNRNFCYSLCGSPPQTSFSC
jgi:hypothetical protein